MFRTFIFSTFSLAVMTACSGAATDSTSVQQQALTEAAASADDAKATAEACFATFETCKTAEGADEAACKTQLRDCLPAEAHPGPHCGPPRGKGKGSPHGPGGDCDGGAPPASGEAGALQPPPPREDATEDDADGGPAGGGHEHRGHRGEGGREPGFCSKVPLPSSPELVACREALDACLVGASDRKACFDAHQTCVKTAFDAARAALEESVSAN